MILAFFEVISFIIFIVFLLLSIRILFVFVFNFNKNKIINKSVYKSVLSGKLSLIIILLFFGISFSLVGGTQLLSKNVQRSLEHQYIDNNIYQMQLVENNSIEATDIFQMNSQSLYNFSHPGNGMLYQTFMKPWIVENSLSWKDENGKIIDENNYGNYVDENGNPLWNIELYDSTLLNTSDNHNWHKDENYQSYGWSSEDWQIALREDLIVRFEGSSIENSWGENKIEGADQLVLGLFGSWENYGKSILFTRIFNDAQLLHPEEGFLYPFKEYKKIGDTSTEEIYNSEKMVSAREVILDYNEDLSYEMTSYMNVTPNSTETNIDFEIKIINDIDWLNGNYLYEEKNPFDALTKKINGREINKETFIDNNKTSKEFIGESRGLNPSSTGYSVLIQNDFLEKNPNIKESGKINFMDLTNFNIYSPVRFNEITYPTMGLNILPNKSKQTFLEMTYSDFVNFSEKYSSYYSSFSNVNESLYFGKEKGYDNLKTINSWKYNSNSFKKISDDFNNFNNNGVDQIINENPSVQKGLLSRYSTTMNDYNSLSSIWAYTGVIEIQGSQRMINIIVIIFMVIVLIVISMLTSKRIKESGKQIGTLKAMGMTKKSIASSYIIYPMIIIFLGFILASILSIPVMILFTKFMGQYYYISFASNPISLGFFFIMLIVPMSLAIGLTYIISIRTLQKSTIDLLNNKNANSPNILVRASGYLTPASTPFAISYMSRGTLRATGKSLLLFTSIFLATLLTGFAMASTTMLEKQTANAMKYLNFDIYNKDSINDFGQYDRKPLWVLGEDSKWHKSYQYGSGEETPINISKSMKNWTTDSINFNHNSPIDFFDEYQRQINLQIKNVVGENNIINYSQNGGVESNYYFTNDFMEKVTFGYAFLVNYYHGQGEDKNFSDLTISPYLPSLIKSWSSSLLFNAIYSTDDVHSINNPSDLKEFLDKYGNDTFIMEKYYDQFSHSSIAHSKIYGYNNSINYNEYSEKNKKAHISDFFILNSIDEMVNSFGEQGTSIGEQIKDDLFKSDLDKVEKGEKLDYIPVIVSTQTMKNLKDGVKNGEVIQDKNDKNQYTISFKTRTISDDSHWGLNTYSTINSEFRVLVKIKVVGKPLFVGVDIGASTIKEFTDNYFSNYLEHDFIGDNGENIESDYSPGSLLEKDKENDLYKLHSSPKYSNQVFYDENYVAIQKTKGSYFNFPRTREFRLRYSKHKPPIEDFFYEEQDSPDSAYNLITTSAVLMDTESYEKIVGKDEFNNDNYTIGYNQLINQEPIVTDTDRTHKDVYFSEVMNKNSSQIPLKFETLLSQGRAAMQMMISMLTFISAFAIFMSITIIIISVKDIIDSSKREVSMLKAFGYSTKKSSTLIIVPYIFIILLAFTLSLPLTFLSLSSIALILTSATGNTFTFTLTILQSLILTVFILGIVLLLLGMSYIAFKNTNALEAINLTNE